MEQHPNEPAPRRMVCEACGTAFDCGLGGHCWCAAESFRLPIPVGGSTEDCLCPACLRAKAHASAAQR